MKSGIHPQYYQAKATCASCNTVIEVGATKPEITLEVCSECHPFYTGKRTMVDTAGRIERYAMKMQKREEMQKQIKATAKASKKSKKSETPTEAQ